VAAAEEDEWLLASEGEVLTSNFTRYEYTIAPLRQGSAYSLRLRLSYFSGHQSVWPLPPTQYVFSTTGSHPRQYSSEQR